MIGRSILALLLLVVCLSACSGDTSSSPRTPDGTTPEGLWLMVMNDCEEDCDEPGLGMGGRFYYARACDPVAETQIGEPIAVADPESMITVPYETARPIEGINVTQAVAVGPAAPSACDSRDLRGWFVVRSQDYLYSNELGEQIASLHQ